MNEIKVDINRSITNKSFWISVITVSIVICLGIGTKNLFPKDAANMGVSTYYHAQMLFLSLRSDIVIMAVPILCTIPYTTGFLDEYTSGFIKVYLMKCDKPKYIKGKVIAPAISGGLILVFGILAYYFIAYFAYSPIEIVDKTAISPFNDVIKLCVQFFICGALWASVGSLLANITLSKYMAYASPFVIFYVLVILSERYFHDIYIISPKEWLLVENNWVLGQWGAVILMLILTVIICTVNDYVIERRLTN